MATPNEEEKTQEQMIEEVYLNIALRVTNTMMEQVERIVGEVCSQLKEFPVEAYMSSQEQSQHSQLQAKLMDGHLERMARMRQLNFKRIEDLFQKSQRSGTAGSSTSGASGSNQ